MKIKMDMERKEAIEVIRKNWPDASFTQLREALETLIPELAESEDERIRKALVSLVEELQRSDKYFSGVALADMLAWLEKQKKVDVTDFCQPIPEDIAKAIPDVVNECIYGEEKQKEQKPSTPEDIAAAYQMGLAKGRNEQKPAEWSKEDKGLLLSVKCIIDEVWHSEDKFGYSEEELKEMWNWLDAAWQKLEYPISSWRPSEEQMEWLKSAVKLSTDKPHIHGIIISLYEQLKRL